MAHKRKEKRPRGLDPVTGQQFDSEEEMYFSWYLDELKEAGYVKDWKHEAKSYVLSDGLTKRRSEPRKRVADKIYEYELIKPSVYTPDFQIDWEPKAEDIFFRCIMHYYTDLRQSKIPYITSNLENECVVEIKPLYDKNNMTRLARTNIKWVWDKHRVYVNLIKVPRIFKDTFTPKRYLLTPTGKTKRITFTTRTLQEFVENQSIKNGKAI